MVLGHYFLKLADSLRKYMKEFKGKSAGELEKMLAEKREALRMFRFEMAGGKIKNVKTGRRVRTDIARILTLMNAQKSQ